MKSAFIAALALALTGSGCFVAAPRHGVVVTTTDPPVPYDEETGPAPGNGYVWTSGYWSWDGARYVWAPGTWACPPEPGYVWTRPGWVRERDRYVFVYGRWSRPKVVVRPHYVHPRPRVIVRPGRRYRHVPRRRR